MSNQITLLNTGLSTNGAYRAILNYDGSEAYVYIPCLNNNNKENFNLKALFISQEMKNTAIIGKSPCWVIFEGGDNRRPIICGYFGNGMRNMGSIVTGGDNSSSGSDNNNDNLSNKDVLKSTNERINEWLNTKQGVEEVGYNNAADAVNIDNYAGIQCVDLILDYVKYLYNLSTVVGNGNQVVSKLLTKHPTYFESVNNASNILPGDILSLTSKSEYGHTGVVKYIKNNTIYMIDQWGGNTNPTDRNKVHKSKVNVSKILGIARPK